MLSEQNNQTIPQERTPPQERTGQMTREKLSQLRSSPDKVVKSEPYPHQPDLEYDDRLGEVHLYFDGNFLGRVDTKRNLMWVPLRGMLVMIDLTLVHDLGERLRVVA